MQGDNTGAPEKNDENITVDFKKKQEKERKKAEKKMEQFMKSIAHLSPDEKIDVLCKKNYEGWDEIRTYKASVQMLQRRIAVLEKEKEQLQNEQSKGVLARSRLETLCRELQRQNKSVKEESLQKIREEEEKRKEVSNRFQAALSEVTQMMQQNTDKNLKLRDDNLEMSNKFQKLCNQFKQREEEVAQITKQMDLEKQLAEATVKRVECQLSAERELWAKEREQLLKQLKLNEEERIKQEVNLKSMEEHLVVYSSRYEEFESTINKSNQVFESYKAEMSRMTKQVNKLEKDCTTWKDRWMQTQRQLNRIISQNQLLETAIKDRERKMERVMSLCRSLQEERTVFLRQLKEAGIEPRPCPELALPSAVNARPKTAKMTKKEKELDDLKKTVRVLENQLEDVKFGTTLNMQGILLDMPGTNDSLSNETSAEDSNLTVPEQITEQVGLSGDRSDASQAATSSDASSAQERVDPLANNIDAEADAGADASADADADVEAALAPISEVSILETNGDTLNSIDDCDIGSNSVAADTQVAQIRLAVEVPARPSATPAATNNGKKNKPKRRGGRSKKNKK